MPLATPNACEMACKCYSFQHMETHWTRQPIQQLKWTQNDSNMDGSYFCNFGDVRWSVRWSPPRHKRLPLVSMPDRYRAFGKLIALALANHCKLAFAPLDSGAERFQNWIPSISMISIVLSPVKRMVIWRVYPIVRTLLDVLCILPEGKCLVCRNHSWWLRCRNAALVIPSLPRLPLLFFQFLLWLAGSRWWEWMEKGWLHN